MRVFIITILIILVVDVLGKTIILYRRDEHRPLWTAAFDMLIGMGLLLWGVWELAKS